MDIAKLYLFNEQIAMQFASLSGLCEEEYMPRREGSGRKKLDDPKSNKVSMRLSSEELLQFEAYAEKHNLSKANVLRKAVKELFERDEKK